MTQALDRDQKVLEPFALVQDLTSKGDLAGTFSRLGELLAPAGLQGSIRVQLVDRLGLEQRSYFTLTIANKKAKLSIASSGKPDVELITTREIWWEIAKGKMAPHDAFFKGLMRVRGKGGLAQDMLKQVSTGGRTHFCKGGN